MGNRKTMQKEKVLDSNGSVHKICYSCDVTNRTLTTLDGTSDARLKIYCAAAPMC